MKSKTPKRKTKTRAPKLKIGKPLPVDNNCMPVDLTRHFDGTRDFYDGPSQTDHVKSQTGLE